ncbi:MAG: hypothetical protein MJ072_04470, partial [Clostridia bacterium]|nr:hypothetical protein [Clostridia bacterium]
MEGLYALGKDGIKAVYEAVSGFALYFTVALAVIMITVFAVVKLKFPEKADAFKKTFLGVIIGYSVTLVSVILFLQIARMHVKGELDVKFFLFLGFFVVLVAGAFCAYFIKGFITVALATVYSVV